MNELDVIIKYLDEIVDYYRTLSGNDNLNNFLRKEIYCIDEALNLVDLSLLPLSESYIEKCRQTVRENLESDDFKKVNRKLRLEVLSTISKIKRYTEMSELERAVYDSFFYLFPFEIEAGDLYIDMFTDSILASFVKEEDFLPILQKHFGNLPD